MVAELAPTTYPSLHSVPSRHGETHLYAARFRRVWAIVQAIADEPGASRHELSVRFHISQRQVQDDLEIIRDDMRLPLVRRQGYRFVAEGMTGTGGFDLHEALLLVMILRRSVKDRSIPSELLASMLAKLPAMFPPHLQPLAGRTLEAVAGPATGAHQVFAALVDALLRGVRVRLHYPSGMSDVPYDDRTPVVLPELLLPYADNWYVIGEIGFQRKSLVRMLNLDGVSAVTLAAEADRGH